MVGIIAGIIFIAIAVAIFGVFWCKRRGKYDGVCCSRSISYFKSFTGAKIKIPKQSTNQSEI